MRVNQKDGKVKRNTAFYRFLYVPKISLLAGIVASVKCRKITIYRFGATYNLFQRGHVLPWPARHCLNPYLLHRRGLIFKVWADVVLMIKWRETVFEFHVCYIEQLYRTFLGG